MEPYHRYVGDPVATGRCQSFHSWPDMARDKQWIFVDIITIMLVLETLRGLYLHLLCPRLCVRYQSLRCHLLHFCLSLSSGSSPYPGFRYLDFLRCFGIRVGVAETYLPPYSHDVVALLRSNPLSSHYDLSSCHKNRQNSQTASLAKIIAASCSCDGQDGA